MDESIDGPHRWTASELQRKLFADRAGEPYLLYRDGDKQQVILTLVPASAPVVAGRSPGLSITLDWDPSVSRAHAKLEYIGDAWFLVDDGLSRNGTYVNGERVANQRRLQHQDVIRMGSTLLQFMRPTPLGPGTTRPERPPPTLTEPQRRVLIALCRPYVTHARSYGATNQEIADELVLATVTVKAHLRNLHALFEIGPLPQNRKRAELMHRALATGTVGSADYLSGNSPSQS